MGSQCFRVYQNKVDGRRIAFPMAGLTAQKRSDIRFRRKVMAACRIMNFRVFGTLTYSDEFLPYSGKHMQIFFKRWREYNRKVRGIGKVEYIWREDFGEKKGRPHYHFFVNAYEDIEKVRLWWGRGFVWLKKIYSKGEVRRYLYKYMCKERRSKDLFMKHRYGSSRGVPPTPKSEWKFITVLWEENLLDGVYVHNQNLGILDNHLGLRISNVSKYMDSLKSR